MNMHDQQGYTLLWTKSETENLLKMQNVHGKAVKSHPDTGKERDAR